MDGVQEAEGQVPPGIDNEELGYLKGEAFECGVCADDFEEDALHVKVDDDPICRECYLDNMKPTFEATLARKDEMPIYEWGRTTLHPSNFPGFSPEFIAEWDALVEEYTLTKREKLYCQNRCRIDDEGRWIAEPSDTQFAANNSTEIERELCMQYLGPVSKIKTRIVGCKKCSGWTCHRCGVALLTDISEDDFHDCIPANMGADPEIDPSLVRGLHYQICPSEMCRHVGSLEDACNTIICKGPLIYPCSENPG